VQVAATDLRKDWRPSEADQIPLHQIIKKMILIHLIDPNESIILKL
jgi:hypothetical protein